MDCSTLAPWAIDLLNYGLTFVTYAPAVVAALLFYGWLDNKVEARYPGIDNRNERTVRTIPVILAVIGLFFLIWSIGLLLTEGFRCISSQVL